MPKSRIALGVVALLAVAAAGLYLAREPIMMSLLRRTATEAIARNRPATLPDGLHAFVCGSGSPLADVTRAGPCLAVVAGGRLFVVDVGDGAADVLQVNGFRPARIERVLLTHLHSDHIDGLGALALQRWAAGAAKTPLPLSGPIGTATVAEGINRAYAIDRGYRVGHHGTDVVPPSGFGLAAQPFEVPATGTPVVIVDDGGVRITAFAVDHRPVSPAVGYRFDYKGRSLVVSGDTRAASSVEAAAKGVDLLVHDALAPRMVKLLAEAADKAGEPRIAKIMRDIPDYHASPVEAAQSAQAAGAKALLITHMVPPLRASWFEGLFLDGAGKAFDGPIWVAADGDLISMPAASTEIEHTHLP